MLDPKLALLNYLQTERDALVWKLSGLSERDIRRPMTPTGTNLLGLVKHCAMVEAGYLGDTFGRPFPEHFAEFDEGAEDNADMWARPEESREDIVGLYRRVWAHGDATVEALELDTIGLVPHWPTPRNRVTLHRILLHVATEVARHAGQADIVRETIDSAAGFGESNSNLPPADAATWATYVAKLQAAADQFA